MNVSSVMNTAFSGMQTQTRKMSAVANNVANIDTPEDNRIDGNASDAGKGRSPDLDTDLTEMLQAKQAFQANAVVFETGADLWELLRTIKRD